VLVLPKDGPSGQGEEVRTLTPSNEGGHRQHAGRSGTTDRSPLRTVHVELHRHLVTVPAVELTQASVPARVRRRGPPDQQLRGGLVYLGHLLFVGDVFAVLLPQDVSLSSGWEDR